LFPYTDALPIYAILAGFDVLHHLAELRPALDRLAGLSRILVFADDLIIVIVCVGFHFGLLGIQRVAVHLHSGGDPGIGVNFCLLFLHLSALHRETTASYFFSVFCSSTLMESR